jgi:hypothetical protein
MKNASPQKTSKRDGAADPLESHWPDLHPQIARRAYYLWKEGGRRDGQAMNHWLQAEREVTALRLPTQNRLKSNQQEVL